MTTRIVKDEQGRELLLRLIRSQTLPFTASVTKGKPRSWHQNRLNRLWCGEIAEQLGDRTPEEVRGDLKLRFGVPILRDENETFREKYDRIIKPLSYEVKMELMMEPMDFPVTRLMDTDQQRRYLDAIFRFFSQKGLVLTEPPDKIYGPKYGTPNAG